MIRLSQVFSFFDMNPTLRNEIPIPTGPTGKPRALIMEFTVWEQVNPAPSLSDAINGGKLLFFLCSYT